MANMLTIKIETDNAAFRDPVGQDDDRAQMSEVLRILKKLCRELEGDAQMGIYSYALPLMDINGNRVGEFDMDVPGV